MTNPVSWNGDPYPPPRVHACIVALMRDKPTIAKLRENTQQRYNFRGIDDFFEVCQPLLARHELHITPYRVVADECVRSRSEKGTEKVHVRQRVEFRIYCATDGSWVQVETTGEALDYGGDKASNKAMAAALKYALMQAFCIPTGEAGIDTEATPGEGAQRAPRPGRPQRPPAGPAKAPPAGGEIDMVSVNAKTESGMWHEVRREARLEPRQQQRIKILQKELQIEDGPWREALFAAYGKSSSSELAASEADGWIGKLEASKAKRAKGAGGTT